MKLALGTVQFGLDYGVSNAKGKVAKPEVQAILELACQSGVSLLDTASAYGDSEVVLGQLDAADSFELISKLPAMRPGDIIEQCTRAFQQSLENLKEQSLYALLVHQADDLLSESGEQLFAFLQRCKSQGKVKKIGVSVYTPAQLTAILDRYPVDLVQLPCNVFDQRFAQAGLIDRLQNNGVEVHARSVFLQGLLLMEPDDLPESLLMAKAPLERFKQACEAHKVSRLSAAIACLVQNESINKLVVGVTSVKELKEIIDAYQLANSVSLAWHKFVVNNESLLNPSCWHNERR